ncbi:MAG: PAS domain S-box protein [Methanocalculus sp. MSAO_Arc1]|uniref:PAS domain S-box protein n=1 Tax=Methanocalculus TaxID=71151 RepID=UPI000FF0089F|nr:MULTISPECIES: PAS domain S-box protein [unclassified Methanocalculus]MCP1661629.1 PAS domain S-box-containing protein [Methanocalculus sp. AMF5]RQD79521.1 MAG: PAS domain S-box protein [Methanocalculus sp. MSAO_Arc1]
MSNAAILIVEDEAVTAMAIQKSLTNLGYSVCGIAPTAEQAVNKARELDPDLILMDIKLAGKKTGIHAAAEINRHKNIPIVYLTAFSDDRIINAAKTTEPFGYILKPVREQELRTTIEMALYRHAMETKLREHEDTIRVLLNATDDMHFLMDTGGTILAANKALADCAGKTHEELVGTDIYDLVSQGCISPKMAGYKFPANQNTSVISTERFGERWFDIGIHPVTDSRGVVIKYAVHIHDITRLKGMEEKIRQKDEVFRSIIDDMADIIIILNQDGTLLQESPSLNRFAGYRDEEKQGRTWFEYLHEDSLETARRLFFEVLKNPSQSRKFELNFQTVHGKTISVQGILSNHVDDPDFLFDGIVLTGWVKRHPDVPQLSDAGS